MGTTALVSLQDFEDLEISEDVELLRGELVHMSLPVALHADICERIYDPLREAFKRRQAGNPNVPCGHVHFEVGYLLTEDPPTLLGPDVSITHPNQPVNRFYQGAPAVVFEVISANDRAQRLEEKIAEYLDHGAGEVWAIFPATRHAWVYRQGTARLETETIRSDFFPEVEIPLHDLLSSASPV
ncbi:MAG TPA: Uma2 family endonuclease [Bryobacteraceae bacterium]|nr:Uma2 family endonuclease [Bryobacteraceae bacterium]